MNKDKRMAYWRANLRLVGLCLIIWFVCSYGFGILFVDQLNTIRIGGFQLGFWFAQQGSIYIFVMLIFFYAWRMNRIDREHDVPGSFAADDRLADPFGLRQSNNEKHPGHSRKKQLQCSTANYDGTGTGFTPCDFHECVKEGNPQGTHSLSVWRQ